MSADELVLDLGERWTEVPVTSDDATRRAWVAEAATRVNGLGAAWPVNTADLVPDLLSHALDRRGDDHLVVLYWPVAAPLPATVRIAVLAAPGRAAIAEDLRSNPAAHVEHVVGARLGPGVEWVHGAALPGTEGAGTDGGATAGEQLIGTQACFADEDTMVLVTLDPTLPALLPHVIDDVRELTRSIGRVRGGRDWTALPLPADVGTRADLEEWPEVGSAVRPEVRADA